MCIQEKALHFAIAKHRGQFRKFSQREYIRHPIDVAELLRSVLAQPDENLIAAAYLHDLSEDCNVMCYELAEMFGNDIAELVSDVTHAPGIHGNRKERWEQNLLWYKHGSARGKTLKLADRICNLREFSFFWEDLPASEKKFVREVYLNESKDLLVLGEVNQVLSNLLYEEIFSLENK